MVNFSEAKEVFRDIIDLDLYVPLSTIEKVKNDLYNLLLKKEKMIFLTGYAGSGKSVVLKKIYTMLKDKEEVFFITNPYLEIDSILDILRNLSLTEHHFFLIDEAQLLSIEVFEKLRIYADKGNVTIVFATHDLDLNKLLQKKHFKTRINYVISIKNSNLLDVENFIRTKLLKKNLINIAEMIKKNNYKLIYKYTKGSLRSTNQLMFKLFDILDYFYKKNPNKISLEKLSNKYIHMAYLDLREVHG